MELPDFLSLDSDGEVRFKGHRLRIIDVAARFREGHSPEGIAFVIFPMLDVRLVYKGIAFYLDHQAEIDRMTEANTVEIER